MFFVIQKEDGRNYNDVEYAILTDLLRTYKGDREYITMREADLYAEDAFDGSFTPKLKTADELDPLFKNAIAIGNISFVASACIT